MFGCIFKPLNPKGKDQIWLIDPNDPYKESFSLSICDTLTAPLIQELIKQTKASQQVHEQTQQKCLAMYSCGLTEAKWVQCNGTWHQLDKLTAGKTTYFKYWVRDARAAEYRFVGFII